MRVGAGKTFAVDALQSDEVSRLKDADKRLATEIVMGTLRWQGALDQEIERLAGRRLRQLDPEVVTLLRMGVYQILFLTRVPPHAVVNDAVELTKRAKKRSAAGLVNAVLRKCKPFAGVDDPSNPETRRLARAAMPAWLLKRWERQFGVDGVSALVWASTQVPPTTLRTSRGDREPVAARLRAQAVETTPGRFAANSLYVRSGDLYKSDIFRSGDVVVQDEASQVVAALLAPRRGHRVLDLCAAPGIKTAQLAEEIVEGTLLACDMSAARLGTMKRLLAGRMARGVRTDFLRLDATRTLPFTQLFDRILVDAPCSGTGTLARNPEIKWRLRPEQLGRLAVMQTAMLRNALAHLAPGGRLVYATCSLEPEEDENVVRQVGAARGCRMLGREELVDQFPAWAELFDSYGYFRTRPDLDGIDGFFAAVIQPRSLDITPQ